VIRNLGRIGEFAPRVPDAALLVAVLLVSYAYFYQAGGWNQNSRFALVRAIVEGGTVRIDAYHGATGDKVVVGGHFYTDKAPGQSFAAVPFVAAGRSVLRAGGVAYLATLVTASLPMVVGALALLGAARRLGASRSGALFGALAASLPMAVGALALLRAARRLGASRSGALFAALAVGLATPAWAYATLFIGHCMAGGALMLAFSAALAMGTASSERQRLLLAAAVGAAGGWATLTEYPAGPAALIVAVLALTLAWPRGFKATVQAGAAIAIGSSGFVVALLAYHQAVFGSPFVTPLEHLYGFPNVKAQPFAWPRAGVLTALFFSEARGLFVLAPVLLAAPVGFVTAWRRPGSEARRRRAAVLAAAAIAVYYPLMNASFATPAGGWIYGPRLMAACFPFLGLGVALAFTHAGVWLRSTLAIAALCGAALSLLAVSTSVQVPEHLRRPVPQLLWPSFKAGQLSRSTYSFLGVTSPSGKADAGFVGRGAWNLGELVGLRGHPSLAPLALAWLGLGALAWRSQMRAAPRKAAIEGGDGS
jgi:hypothetical protein